MRDDRPSATARLVALATLVAAREPDLRELVPPDAVTLGESLLASSRTDRCFRALTRTRPTRALLLTMERLLLPGLVTHFQLRKRHIENAWREARRESCTQLLVLGAGLDTLGIRAAADPEVRVIEVDHPATHRLKQDWARARSTLTLVPLRLDGGSHYADLLAALDTDRPTLIVAEGLLMYLPRDKVLALLTEMRNIVRAPVRFLGTFMHHWPDGTVGFRPQSRWVQWWLKVRREPFLWGATPTEIEAMLRDTGWALQRLTTGEGLRAGGRWRGCVGESIFEAVRE